MSGGPGPWAPSPPPMDPSLLYVQVWIPAIIAAQIDKEARGRSFGFSYFSFVFPLCAYTVSPFAGMSFYSAARWNNKIEKQ